MDCIFCKIVAGDIPAEKVMETDSVLAFMDINPFNKGHVLVIPKGHYDKMVDTPDDDVAAVALAVKEIASAVMKAADSEKFNVLVYGDDVPHYHVHVYPRFDGDGITAPAHKSYEEGEISEMASRIREYL